MILATSTASVAEMTPETTPSVEQHDHQANPKHENDGAFHHRFNDANKWAKQFDNADRDQWQQPEKLLDALAFPDNALVADIGAGTGYFSSRLAKRLPNGKVYAADVEEDMVRYLGERAQRENLNNLVAIQASPQSPMLPEPVDLILLVDAYHHIGHRQDYFKQLQSSLKANGRLVIVDFKAAGQGTPPKEHLVLLDQTRDELQQAGYSLSTTLDFLPKQYVAIFQKAENTMAGGQGMPQHKHFADAEHYAQRFESPEREVWQKPEQVLDTLNLPLDARVADIGAGTGYFSARLAARLPQGKVYASDSEPNMVRYLTERANREQLTNLTAVQASSQSPNLPEPVDFMLFVNAYHLINDRGAYFSQLQTSLKPNGKLVIVDWRMDSPDTPPKMRLVAFEDAKNELEAAGFSLIATHDFLPRQYIAIYEKRSH
jgi:cyclopropane fatty-acyl-phospholipid synthase-like methyltransferase